MSPKHIKKLRKSFGFTQKVMARAFGVGTLTMSQYENGVRNPGPTALILLELLDSLPKKRSLELFKLFHSKAKELKLGSGSSTHESPN